MNWYAVGRDSHKTAAAGDWLHGSGSLKSFDRFDLNKDREWSKGWTKHWNSHLGFHFTSEHKTAVEIANDGGGHVYHVKLAMKNPKHYDSEHELDQHGYAFAKEKGYFGNRQTPPNVFAEGVLRNHPDIKNIASHLVQHLRDQGHDGITYGNEIEGTRRHKCAIAFHPDDITIISKHRGDQACPDGLSCSTCGTPHIYGSRGSDCQAENCHGSLVGGPDEPGNGVEHQGALSGVDSMAQGDTPLTRQGTVQNTLTVYPNPREHGFYEYPTAQAGTTREGGKGRPRLDNTGDRDRGAQEGQGRQRADPVGRPQGGDSGDGPPRPVGRSTPRPHTMHSKVGKEMKSIPNPHRRHIAEGIEGLLNDDPVYANKTHALGTYLKGWNSTHVGRGYVIVHQPIKGTDGIHFGYVGLHDYSEAIRRLTVLTDAEFVEAEMEKEAMGANGPDYDNLRFTHHNTRRLSDRTIEHLNNHEWMDTSGEDFDAERSVAGPDDHVMFAHHQDHGIVGLIRYARNNIPLSWGKPYISIDMMQVSPEHHRRGVASAMQDDLADRYPDQMIQHGSRTPPGDSWAAGYFKDGEPDHGRRNGARTGRALVAYFHSSQDATRAMNALERLNAQVSAPEPVQPPQNGRSWRLVIEPVAGGLSGLYQDPTRVDQVVGIVLKFNGITNV